MYCECIHTDGYTRMNVSWLGNQNVRVCTHFVHHIVLRFCSALKYLYIGIIICFFKVSLFLSNNHDSNLCTNAVSDSNSSSYKARVLDKNMFQTKASRHMKISRRRSKLDFSKAIPWLAYILILCTYVSMVFTLRIRQLPGIVRNHKLPYRL